MRKTISPAVIGFNFFQTSRIPKVSSLSSKQKKCCFLCSPPHPTSLLQLNETAKQLMEIDKPAAPSAPGPSSEPTPLGPCVPGPSPCSSPSNGNGSAHRRGEGKKNAKKRHSFSALSVSQRAAQLNNRHSMEISHPVLISSSDPRAAARIQVRKEKKKKQVTHC